MPQKKSVQTRTQQIFCLPNATTKNPGNRKTARKYYSMSFTVKHFDPPLYRNPHIQLIITE